jgi:hypothetical protein
MATTPKTGTTARKPAKKRSTQPTKAQALKKLGLTEEDLIALKKLTAASEKATANPEPYVDLQALQEQEKAASQQAAKRAAALALQQAGLPVPKELQAETGVVGEDKPDVWYARNTRGVEVRFRLSRQSDRGKKPTLLKPRGQRGDLFRLEEHDLEDPELQTQVAYGLIEIIPYAEAKAAIEKQGYNIQAAPHPALSALRTPTGKEYEQGSIRTEAEFNSQGQVVAHLDPVPNAPGLGNIRTDARGGIDRSAPSPDAPAEPGRMLGGNPAILSDGFAAMTGDNAKAAQADAIARRKDLEGPAAAGIGRVSVDPVQKA